MPYSIFLKNGKLYRVGIASRRCDKAVYLKFKDHNTIESVVIFRINTLMHRRMAGSAKGYFFLADLLGCGSRPLRREPGRLQMSWRPAMMYMLLVDGEV